MALVAMRQLLDHAAENGYGIPAFNVNNLEQVQAIMEAAKETGAPVILQASAGARKYAGELFLEHLIRAAVESYPDIPVAMHLDHGRSKASCVSAMRHGFTSVMMDGSLMPDGKTVSTYEYNVETTRCIVETAHCIGVSVEGELGCIGSLETLTSEKEDGQGAEGTLTRCSPIRIRQLTSSARPSLMPSLSRSARATVLISSPANPRAKFCRLTA